MFHFQTLPFSNLHNQNTRKYQIFRFPFGNLLVNTKNYSNFIISHLNLYHQVSLTSNVVHIFKQEAQGP